jgi:hypothetical protein
MIPAPTFVYREAATPAKWLTEESELPSPFLRRIPSAPPASGSSSQDDYSGAGSRERAVLGAINLQSSIPSASTASSSVQPTLGIPGKAPAGSGAGTAKSHGTRGSGNPGLGTGSTMPRSKSGNMHQQVLRANAVAAGRGGTGITDGTRVRPVGGRENQRI